MNVIIELIPGIITLIVIAITGIWLLKVIFKYHPDNGGKPEDFVMADHLYDVYKAKVA